MDACLRSPPMTRAMVAGAPSGTVAGPTDIAWPCIKPGQLVRLARNQISLSISMPATMSLRSLSLQHPHFQVSFPHERVVQVTLNRPEKLNCIDLPTSRQIQQIWELFDQDESLWVGIITGAGRAFCTGADLQGTSVDGLLLHVPSSNYRVINRVERHERSRSCQRHVAAGPGRTPPTEWQKTHYRGGQRHLHGGRI